MLQACEMLGMYQAELASILKLRCTDMANMARAKKRLDADSISWQKAILFIKFYQLLFERFNGDQAQMYHWLRKDGPELKKSPLVLMVDEGRIEFIIKHLSTENNF